MDYKRIYDEFIADRLNKQPSKPDYFERHHILPKSLGGGNESSNIINLTPGDHYFAHLCLAKIYGGKQWLGVICMTKMLVSNNRAVANSMFSNRKMVNVAREKSAKHKSKEYKGKLTRSSKPVFTIFNINGKSETGSMIELSEKTGVSLTSIYRIVKKIQGKSYSGWYFDYDFMINSNKIKVDLGKKLAKKYSGSNKKQIICDQTGKIYNSFNDVKKITGIDVKNFFYKNRNHAGGFTWSII